MTNTEASPASMPVSEGAESAPIAGLDSPHRTGRRRSWSTDALLAAIREHGTLTAAASALGIHPNTISGARRRDAALDAALKEALLASRRERSWSPRIPTDTAHETYAFFEGSTARHGTQSGWTRHQAAGERPCDPCYRAKQDYDRRRLESPQRAQRNRLRARAQARAHMALVRLHKTEYDALYKQALAEIFGADACRDVI